MQHGGERGAALADGVLQRVGECREARSLRRVGWVGAPLLNCAAFDCLPERAEARFLLSPTVREDEPGR